MSAINQYPTVLNWQSISPVIGFLPTHPPGGSIPSGATASQISVTNTTYSNIIDASKMKLIGIVVTYTGTPTGILSVWVSNDGANFGQLTGFNPPIDQPSGAPLIEPIYIKYPFKFIYLQYVNSSGTGSIAATMQLKD